jgi:hypothetical protein
LKVLQITFAAPTLVAGAAHRPLSRTYFSGFCRSRKVRSSTLAVAHHLAAPTPIAGAAQYFAAQHLSKALHVTSQPRPRRWRYTSTWRCSQPRVNIFVHNAPSSSTTSRSHQLFAAGRHRAAPTLVAGAAHRLPRWCFARLPLLSSLFHLVSADREGFAAQYSLQALHINPQLRHRSLRCTST